MKVSRYEDGLSGKAFRFPEDVIEWINKHKSVNQAVGRFG